MVLTQDTVNKIRLDVDSALADPYFLIVFTCVTENKTITAIFENRNLDCDFFLIYINDVTNYGTVNALSGIIALTPSGTWSANIYAQASSTNLLIANATFLETQKVQVYQL